MTRYDSGIPGMWSALFAALGTMDYTIHDAQGV